MKDSIAERICSFFKTTIQPKLKDTFDSYIIDFALVGDEYKEIVVIELNPFLSSTDGCLFSWKRERKLIEQGPFEFRILTKIPHGGKSLLSTDWRVLLESANNISTTSTNTTTIATTITTTSTTTTNIATE